MGNTGVGRNLNAVTLKSINRNNEDANYLDFSSPECVWFWVFFSGTNLNLAHGISADFWQFKRVTMVIGYMIASRFFQRSQVKGRRGCDGFAKSGLWCCSSASQLQTCRQSNYHFLGWVEQLNRENLKAIGGQAEKENLFTTQLLLSQSQSQSTQRQTKHLFYSTSNRKFKAF